MNVELYAPVIAKTNLYFDQTEQRLKIALPARANIALDTVGRHAKGEKANHTALVFEDASGTLHRYTFAELDALSSRLAKGLLEKGVRRGDPVAVHTGQRPETAIAHFAIHKLGAIVLTLSQLYGPDTVEHILNDSKCKVVITDEAAWENLRAHRARFASLEHCIVVGDPGPGEIPFHQCLTADGQGLELVQTATNDPALLMYTSGSTGMPKGMLHAHRIIHAYLPTLTMVYNLELDKPGQVFWSPADWAWVGGLLDLVLPAWQAGQTVIATQHRFEAAWAFDFMARHGVTHSFMTPTALKRLAEIDNPRSHWDLRVRVICTGGESLPGNVVRWAQQDFGIVCNEFYGLTEFNHMVGNCQALYPIEPGSMGRAMPGRRVAIIDELGNEQPDGEVGEIASWRPDDPTLFLGYWGSPGVPEKMRVGKWLRSGDLAVRDKGGYFWYEGRNDDLIKSAGYRIGPAEVEDALVKHPRVAEAAVVGCPDPERGSIVMAFVRLARGAKPSDALKRELQDFVKKNLAAYKYPREIEFVGSFPLTSSGKIRRNELRARAASSRTP
ncbi:MAG: AMP-binding protein [Acidiferrobacterales bacterium]